MITENKNGTYQVDVFGGADMDQLVFDPGPSYSGGRKQGEVCFKTVPEGWWGISYRDFLMMALLAIQAAILDTFRRR